jgi:hypothetical protein
MQASEEEKSLEIKREAVVTNKQLVVQLQEVKERQGKAQASGETDPHEAAHSYNPIGY